MTKHFLYLTNEKLIALVWKNGAIVERESFVVADNEGGRFGEYLARHHLTPAWLITDLIEEDFRTETIPHLRGSDQDAVLARRLGQLYRATPFRHAVVQGREPEGRRDDRVMYHAITNAELVQPWLDTLKLAEVPLQGVCSSAVLSGALPKAMNAFYPHTLLVTIVPEFGLRQTYFRDAQVKFSRLTPIHQDDERSIGELIAAEASRTWQYLDSLRFFAGDDETLEVCMVVHAKDREPIAEALRAYPLFKYRILEIGEIAAKVKLKPAPLSSHAEEVLVHLYAQQSLENHFAEPAVLRFAKYRRVRMALFGVTAVILLIASGVTFYNLQQAALVSAEVDRRAQVVAGLTAEYQSIANLLRGQTAETAAMRDTSLFYRAQAMPQTASPGDLLREVSTVWSAFEDLRLEQVIWAPHHDAAFIPVLQVTPGGETLNVRSESRPGAANPPGQAPVAVAPAQPAPTAISANDPDPPLPGRASEILMIEGSLTGFKGDYRAALARIQLLIDRLNALPQLKAGAHQLPVDTRSDSTLFGKVAGTDGREARFVLRVVKSRVNP